MFQRLIYVISLGCLILTFQNCSDVAFGPMDAGLTKVMVNGNDGEAGDDEVLPPSDGNDVADDDSDDDRNDPEIPAPNDVAANDDDEGDDGEEPEGVEDDDDADDDVVEQGLMQYICILDGPGKSVRLGYVDSALTSQGKTPGIVCMSQNACLNIVSKKFDVKMAAKRGFCPDKNPHVVPMSDAQLSALIGN